MEDSFRHKLMDGVLENMADGVLVIGLNGIIEMINEPALTIFGMTGRDLAGQSFAASFFNDERNSAFTDSILDTIRNDHVGKEQFLSFETESGIRKLRLTTSYYKEDGEAVGVILVIHDMTDLVELQDAMLAMERIRKLNEKLEIRNQLLKNTFGRYLSDEIVTEILDTPDGLKMGGQKKELTIMMSDLRGFTQLCEQMEPTELLRMLNHYFDEMYREISRYGGCLIEFLGDGMLIVFGAPRASETHASDAVAAALSMQKRMEQVNRWNRENGFALLAMGIGIHTAEVIVGNIGSEQRTKYGVMGAPVNLAGRIESYTTGGQVLISPDTRATIREELRINREMTVSPKGVKGEITLYDVGAIGAPYGISLEVTSGEMKPLASPTEIMFFGLDGKHVDDRSVKGRIFGLSEDCALLTTDVPLQLYANICIDIGQDLYAKVVAREERGWRISFTARPGIFHSWKEKLLK